MSETHAAGRLFLQLTYAYGGEVKLSDLTTGNTSARFADGQTSATIAFTILPDLEPELEETLATTLGPVILGNGTVRADAAALSVVIPENDNPRGIFTFAPVHATLARYAETPGPLDPPGIRLDIIRGAGTRTAVTLQCVAPCLFLFLFTQYSFSKGTTLCPRAPRRSWRCRARAWCSSPRA